MRKIIYFLRNGVPTDYDLLERKKMEVTDKVIFSNGSFPYGFEDSCDAIIMNDDFPHIEKWAKSKGIEILPYKTEPEPEPEVKPKPTRGRKKTEPEPKPE